MSNVEIIKLLPEQWWRYREIRLEALREEPQAFGSTYAEMARRPAAFWQGRLEDAGQGKNSALLFAQAGERLIGMIGAFYDETQETAEIVSVYVSKMERGKGVGKALMEGILCEIGNKAELRKAVLGVNQEQTAAVELYRRFGFEVTGEKEELQGDGQKHRGYLMERRNSQLDGDGHAGLA
jgi:ribosomal protein S18 acetylase RimI-like enzyme